jgi:signal transduction histidine kinase
MSRNARTPQTSSAKLAAGYARALRGYLRQGGEKELRSGYEFGRRSLAGEMSVMEIASAHHECLAELSSRTREQAELERAVRMSGQFLVEALSPYEMRQRAYREAVSALRQLNELLEQEVRRIAHTVHDEAGQLLVAAHLAIADVSRGSNLPGRKQLLQVSGLLDQVGNQLRQLSHELRPTMLDDLGLVPAVRHLAGSVAQRTDLSIRVRSTMRGRLPAPVEIGVYRVIQEALANAAKHSRAKIVTIEIERNRKRLLCTVKDDGVGFKPEGMHSGNGRKGLGFRGIRERLHGLGGTVRVLSRPGRGCTLEFMIHMED